MAGARYLWSHHGVPVGIPPDVLGAAVQVGNLPVVSCDAMLVSKLQPTYNISL